MNSGPDININFEQYGGFGRVSFQSEVLSCHTGITQFQGWTKDLRNAIKIPYNLETLIRLEFYG